MASVRLGVCVLALMFCGAVTALRAAGNGETAGQENVLDANSDEMGAVAPEKPDPRILGVLPNYRTADQTVPFKPLTARQKISIFSHDSFDWPGYFIVGYYTGVAQLENRNKEFGQGAKGYALRYGTTFGDQVVGNFMTEGLLPTLLHEDPRYYRRAHGNVLVRTAYAMSRIAVTRTDRNTISFNYSEFVGNGIAASVGNAWYPKSRSWADTGDRLQNQLLNDAISNCIKEFWPDIKRKLFPKHAAGHSG